MLNTKQLNKTCKAALVGFSLSLVVSGCAPLAETRPPSAEVIKRMEQELKNDSLQHDMRAWWNLERVESAIAAGADVNAKDKRGETALMNVSGVLDGIDYAKLLIAHGAKVDIKDSYGCTALMMAIRPAFGTSKDMVKLLLEHGANPNMQDKNGTTLLMGTVDNYAWASRYFNSLKESLFYKSVIPEAEFPSFIQKTDANMDTVKRNHREIAELLFAAGADPNLKDNNGKTALTIAIDHQETEMADLLRRHGAR
jgi:serine/threonine-protein phosphatase 6 regulatory ankyrin repeat subunit A/serine/threonine-protein phosphatase 6 regulatory ankyrin repeat subunit B